jgi:hypothetical protein
MATDTQQQVDELLADLAAVFDDEPSDDGQPDPEALDELVDRADEIVSTTDLPVLMATTGLSEENEPPASLPAAVASGAPQNVARLRSLLTASKLSTVDDGREERVDELQSLVETAQREPSAEDETVSDTTGDDTESTTDATGEETEATEPTERKTKKKGDEESTSSFRELLESQLEETHGIFDQIPDLEKLTGSLGEDDEEKTETVDEDESQEDQSTRKSDGTRWRPGGGKQRTTHSTVPGAGRRDIGRRPGRFSTVRGSTVSKR